MSKKNVDVETEVKAAEEKPKHNVWDAFWRGTPGAAEETAEVEETEKDEKPGFRWF